MFERQILGAVVAGGAVLALLAWGAQGHRERDQVVAWAKVQCAAAQAPYDPAPKSKAKPGEACAVAIADLAAFKTQAQTQTGQILADAMTDQARRTSRALDQARAAAAEARAAAQQMDAANAQVQADDLVGRDWFDALNRSGGLRDPAS
jgi:hypothetical protein